MPYGTVQTSETLVLWYLMRGSFSMHKDSCTKPYTLLLVSIPSLGRGSYGQETSPGTKPLRLRGTRVLTAVFKVLMRYD